MLQLAASPCGLFLELFQGLLKIDNSTLCYKGGTRLIFAECKNGRPPEKHTILFFRPIIVNIIIVKKLWLGKKIVQW